MALSSSLGSYITKHLRNHGAIRGDRPILPRAARATNAPRCHDLRHYRHAGDAKAAKEEAKLRVDPDDDLTEYARKIEWRTRSIFNEMAYERYRRGDFPNPLRFCDGCGGGGYGPGPRPAPDPQGRVAARRVGKTQAVIVDAATMEHLDGPMDLEHALQVVRDVEDAIKQARRTP